MSYLYPVLVEGGWVLSKSRTPPWDILKGKGPYPSKDMALAFIELLTTPHPRLIHVNGHIMQGSTDPEFNRLVEQYSNIKAKIERKLLIKQQHQIMAKHGFVDSENLSYGRRAQRRIRWVPSYTGGGK